VTRQQVLLLPRLQNPNQSLVLFDYRQAIMPTLMANHVMHVLKVDTKHVMQTAILVNALRLRTGMVQCVYHNYFRIRLVRKRLPVDQISISSANQVVTSPIDACFVSHLNFIFIRELLSVP
jgi:hypothetical protein